MSYKILYDPELIHKFPKKRHCTFSFSWKAMIIAFILASVIIMGKQMHEKRHPHNMEITSAAFTEMIDDLNAGETIIAAFSDFCVKIINCENETDC